MLTSYRDWLNHPILERLDKMADQISQGESAAAAAWATMQATLTNQGSVLAEVVVDIMNFQSGTAVADPDQVVEFLNNLAGSIVATNSMVVASTGSVMAVLPAVPVVPAAP